ncbi:MAG: peptidase MA family metallohydrolase [Thermoguttaceae bacterium]
MKLYRHWLGCSPKAAWRPRCDVVIHPSRDSYLKAAGEGGRQSTGVSYVEVREGAIAVRRIDLYGEQTGCETASLPHELTHILLADRFHDRRIPPWADEGAAVLADPVGKQQLHLHDLEAALAGNTTFDVRQLFGLQSCPPSPQCGTFYGQSLSLVDFLVRRAGPQRFVAFLGQATRIGYEQALNESYGIRGVDELDRLWREHASSPKRLWDVTHLFGATEPAGLPAHGETPGF